MLLENERLNFYFDDAMEEIDCQKVLSLWKNETNRVKSSTASLTLCA
jgi:hypothetical protein